MTTSEEFRHQCEVRKILSMATKEQRQAFFRGAARTRSAEAVAKLQQDVMIQWKKGNRGEHGVWL